MQLHVMHVPNAPQECAKLQKEIEHARKQLETAKQEYAYATSGLNARTVAEHIATAVKNSPELAAAQGRIISFLPVLREHFISYGVSAPSMYKATIRSIRTSLSMRKRKLGTYKKTILCTKQIEATLSRYQGYKKGSFSMGTRKYPILHGTHGLSYNYIRFVYTGVKMTPSWNPFTWLTVEDGPLPEFLLGDIEVICNLDSTRIYFFSANRKGLNFHGKGEHGPYCHPHVMSNYDPCLGGFQAGAQIALTDLDIPMLFLTLKTFLEQANQDDSAGKQWRQVVLNAVTEKTNYITVRYDNSMHNVLHVTKDEFGDEIHEEIPLKASFNNATQQFKFALIIPEKLLYEDLWP